MRPAESTTTGTNNHRPNNLIHPPTSRGIGRNSQGTAEGAERLFGIPVTVTSRIPTGKAVLADMSLVAVARDMAPTVVIDSSRYFDTDEVALRVVARFDLALLQPKAVTVLTAA